MKWLCKIFGHNWRISPAAELDVMYFECRRCRSQTRLDGEIEVLNEGFGRVIKFTYPSPRFWPNDIEKLNT